MSQQPPATFVGHGGYSADGLGQDNTTGGTVQAEVPAGSTVVQAYLYGTYEPAPGTVDEEAFRRMDEYALREVERAAEEADEVWPASRRRCEPQAGLEPEAGQ